MSNSGYASPEQYAALIQALQKFNQDILQSTENMSNCGKVCKDTMGSDALSSNAIAKLDKAVVAYHSVVSKSSELQAKLAREREEVMRLIALSRMEDE